MRCDDVPSVLALIDSFYDPLIANPHIGASHAMAA
jgi:hypothetical protein